MMAKGGNGIGIYSATYSGIPVYEFLFGPDLKESVMRRRKDNWVNATHILKAAGFDKPSRTRILEREVQKGHHEKIQGGYGKYQGTWIPLESGCALAERNQILEKLKPILEYQPGDQSPPPAPRHTSKPKQPKKPSVPKWNPPPPPPPPEFDENDDDTPDNLTVASASYMGEDDRADLSQTGHRKRKRDEHIHDPTAQQHAVYGDELLDYFLLCKDEKRPIQRPEPPPNFQANWPIDNESHTPLHWAAAMGDLDLIRQLKRFGARLDARNLRGETPFMRAVTFTNCYEKETFPKVIAELQDSFSCRDSSNWTVIHHATTTRNERITGQSCSRYYLDNILNRLLEIHEPSFVQNMMDAQDNDGNTALHLAANRNARKCIRALLGRNASTDIPNNEGKRADELIAELNARTKERAPQRSSSPFGPESDRRPSFRDSLTGRPISSSRRLGGLGGGSGAVASFNSEAAHMVSSKITPLICNKLEDLARSYEEEWQEKTQTQSEAAHLLANSQAELDAVDQQIHELEARLEPEEDAMRRQREATRSKYELQSIITQQKRAQVQAVVEQELAQVNGDASASANDDDHHSHDDSYGARLQLARRLDELIREQRAAEDAYVDALSMMGTGDKIEQYRRLLKQCLDHPKDTEILDDNLDSLIEMMEEEKDVGDATDAVAAHDVGESMDIAM